MTNPRVGLILPELVIIESSVFHPVKRIPPGTVPGTYT